MPPKDTNPEFSGVFLWEVGEAEAGGGVQVRTGRGAPGASPFFPWGFSSTWCLLPGAAASPQGGPAAASAFGAATEPFPNFLGIPKSKCCGVQRAQDEERGGF